jgi:hypothetical protein
VKPTLQLLSPVTAPLQLFRFGFIRYNSPMATVQETAHRQRMFLEFGATDA